MKVRIAVAPGIGPGLDPAFIDGLERLGFDTVWLSDVPQLDIVDPIVGLAFAAARTTRLKLGANVVPLGRNQVALAKALAGLDQLSGGRLLLSLVPGLDPVAKASDLETIIPRLRGWWAGEEVDGVVLPSRPLQSPLELWLGGQGPKALDRVGRLADGWLGAGVGPDAAGEAVRTITASAERAGRAFDAEHLGLSIPYARTEPDGSAFAGLLQRYPHADPADLLPVGREGLRALLARHVDQGLSKFVVRPSHPVTDWDDELGWLADAVLDVQT